MPSVLYPARQSRPAESLIILLPGALHGPQDFLREGFAEAVQERKLPLDLQLAELEFEYVANEQALPALRDELLQPALESGYHAIWLAGISIGGYVAMRFADRFQGLVHGLFLMAPYPGNRMTTNEIAAAGGLHAWQPGTVAEDDAERGNWRWLQQPGNVEVHLGYGSEDRYATAHAMMAEALPADRVDCVPGDHDWPVWRLLWARFLDRRFGGNHG
jgi:pimeloyl-ACP methyl ester carboxylesterase